MDGKFIEDTAEKFHGTVEVLPMIKVAAFNGLDNFRISESDYNIFTGNNYSLAVKFSYDGPFNQQYIHTANEGYVRGKLDDQEISFFKLYGDDEEKTTAQYPVNSGGASPRF